MGISLDGVLEADATANRTVLILDADPGLRTFLAPFLSRSRFRLVQVQSERQMLTVLRSTRPRVIVLDFALVGTSRMDLIGLLRRNDEWRRIPLLVMSDETAGAFPTRVDAPVIYKLDRGGLVARLEAALAR